MSFSSKFVLNVYLPDGAIKVLKYAEGTDVHTIVQLVVSKLGQSLRPYSRSYALYLRHTDATKVCQYVKYAGVFVFVNYRFVDRCIGNRVFI